ncbi:hypothetical protein TNCV_50431 [Trichonephila clavipes]|nr:hypothetical protein TNCV_50431 [Trichonephila clavipes]
MMDISISGDYEEKARDLLSFDIIMSPCAPAMPSTYPQLLSNSQARLFKINPEDFISSDKAGEVAKAVFDSF